VEARERYAHLRRTFQPRRRNRIAIDFAESERAAEVAECNVPAIDVTELDQDPTAQEANATVAKARGVCVPSRRLQQVRPPYAGCGMHVEPGLGNVPSVKSTVTESAHRRFALGRHEEAASGPAKVSSIACL
jgi:hypothetical protein